MSILKALFFEYYQCNVEYFYNHDSNDERVVYHLPLRPTMMSKEEKIIKSTQLGEEAYQEWFNQPPIQFPLHPESPFQIIFLDFLYTSGKSKTDAINKFILYNVEEMQPWIALYGDKRRK